MMTRLLALLPMLVLSLALSAQDFFNQMEDTMYDSGRINVVLGVVIIIFTLFFLYLIRLDKKVSRLEKELE